MTNCKNPRNSINFPWSANQKPHKRIATFLQKLSLSCSFVASPRLISLSLSPHSSLIATTCTAPALILVVLLYPFQSWLLSAFIKDWLDESCVFFVLSFSFSTEELLTFKHLTVANTILFLHHYCHNFPL